MICTSNPCEVRNGIGEVSTLKVGVLRYDLTRSFRGEGSQPTKASVVWGPMYQNALHQRYIKMGPILQVYLWCLMYHFSVPIVKTC